MIFRRLTLHNFRQFVGTHEIFFASEPDRNVTVIHGDNGSGKTTILNAFTWLFYQETSSDFEFPERLASEAGLAELSPQSTLDVYVDLEFEDSGRVYTIRRTTSATKDLEGKRSDSAQTSLRVSFIDETGEVQDPGNPQNFIEHLLPKPLYPFFFFNGERIERLAGPGAYDEVETGVKVLMDIELFDRSIAHLEKEISRRLRDEIAGHSGEEGKQLKVERDKLEEAQSKRRAEVEQNQRNQREMLVEKEEIDKKLALMPELAKLQAERKSAEDAFAVAQDQLKATVVDLCKVVSRDGYLVIAPRVLTTADELLAKAHETGDLPVKIKRQFVDELLNRQECICGRPIIVGSKEHDCVGVWRNRAQSDALDAAVTVTKAEIAPLLTRRQRALDDLDRLQQTRADLKKAIRGLDEKRDQLSSDILKITRNQNVEDPDKLEHRRRQIEQAVQTAMLRVNDLQREIESEQDEIKRLDERLTKLEKTDEQARIAEKRLVAVNNVAGALKRIRDLRHENLQADLSERLSAVWDQIALKDYVCQLGPQYRLTLLKQIGAETAPVLGTSTGEKQILSLAFVGALVDKAKSTYEQYKDDAQRMFRGGLYSIIMDSAFGNLGSDYRRGVAAAIPTLAPQVIVLVSETQWRVEVEQELNPRIGREYVLCLYTQKKKERKVTLRNSDYEYVKQSTDGFERTEPVEVKS
jgi:DNA sulfur modification protein DndD